MFTSRQHLHYNLGIDENIAAFFVDRKVPENNRYWKGKYLYVAKGTGYLFIPLFFDLQYKSGVDLKLVLDEEYVALMEQILDSAALHEFEEINFAEHLNNCKRIMDGKVNNTHLYDSLLRYFENDQLQPYKNLGTKSKALNRGDSFLFSACFLNIDTVITDKIVEAWYALVPSFLLMDDISDLHKDLEKNEENSVLDFGQGNIGVENAIKFLRDKFNQLKTLNDTLGCYFENSLDQKIQTPYLQSLLSH